MAWENIFLHRSAGNKFYLENVLSASFLVNSQKQFYVLGSRHSLRVVCREAAGS